MAQIEYPIVTRQPNNKRKLVTLKVPHEFAKALSRYAEEQSALHGRLISQSNILTTLALLKEPRLRQLVKEELQKS